MTHPFVFTNCSPHEYPENVGLPFPPRRSGKPGNVIMRVPVMSLNVGRVRNKRPVGRAAIPRRDVPPSPTTRQAGRARVGQAIGKAPPNERAKTSIIKPSDETPPVFVDLSGGRRRRLRRIAYLIGAVLVLVLVLLWFSQFGHLR
jgi:hypothetical protein